MYPRSIKKMIFVLNIGNYAPEITELTYPLIEVYANKIGASIYHIKERRFPEWDLDYEKLQIYDLSKEQDNDWNIYIDSDALVHPELIDITEFIPINTVAHNGSDMANVRWRYDKYFRRDGRNIGSCNWLAVASSLCTDLWHPLEDMTMEEAVKNILPTVEESNKINMYPNNWVVSPEHLVSDYTLSRNIAKYGLKFTTLINLFKDLGLERGVFFWHVYTFPNKTKLIMMKGTLHHWKIRKITSSEAKEFMELPLDIRVVTGLPNGEIN
jgi:hypothetical protein